MKCNYGSCQLKTDINPNITKSYHYCKKHRVIRSTQCSKEYIRNKSSHKRSGQNYNKKIRIQFLEIYGQCCNCCGEDFEPFLTLDHVRGDGKEHRTNSDNSRINNNKIYREAIENVDKSRFQTLCMNCNFAKRTHKECPCKYRKHDL